MSSVTKQGNIRPEDLPKEAVLTSDDSYILAGLFVQAKGTPDLNIRVSEGLVKIGGKKVYSIGQGDDGLSAIVATAGKEKVAIVQINLSGVISVKDGTEVTLTSGIAGYPNPDSGNILLARLFTAASPIIPTLTAVINVAIDNTIGNRR